MKKVMENIEQNNPSQMLEGNDKLLEKEPLLSHRDPGTVADDSLRKSISKVPGSCSGQDSGLSSAEGSSQCPSSPGKGIKSLPYLTSTPKKGARFVQSFNKYEILPSQMILDDPLLSSIDEPGGDLTDQEVNSLTSDEETEDSCSTRHYETKIRADLDSTSTNCSLMSRLMSDGSTERKIKRSHSFSGTIRRDIVQPDFHSVKSLYDIPVSPKLKSRVRQRLYTLVNSIDGYKGKVDIENEENKMSKCETRSSLTNCEDVAVSSKPKFVICRNNHNKSHEASSSYLLSQLVTDGNKSCVCDKEGQNESINLSRISSVSNDISERYGNAMSTMLETQVRTLHHQEQLSKEKMKFTLQKKEEEADAKIALYRDKLYQMVQMVEDMELKLENSEKEKLWQTRYLKNKTKQQSERHKESLALLRLECEKKAIEAESTIAAVRMEATKSCDRKIYEIMKSTRERTAAIEKEHQDHIFQLNASIAKLRAEKRDIELQDINRNVNTEMHLLANITQISKEKDVLKAEIDTLKQRLGPACEADRKTVEQQKHISELEIKQRTLEEEVNIWRDEAKKWQQKLRDLEIQFERQTRGALEESQRLAQDKLENLKAEFTQEQYQLNNTIEKLEEKLSDALNENAVLRQQTSRLEKKVKEQQENQSSISALEKEVISLGAQLRDSVSKLLLEKENFWRLQQNQTKELAEMKEQHEQEMINYRLYTERERSLAVSKAMVHREEETKALLKGVETRYQELLNTVQAHFKAQLEEYKKAVKILKVKVKKMEEGSAM